MANRLPITRVSKFLSQNDFDLQISMGTEYLHGDLNMKIIVYQVDTEKTDIDNVYSEVGKDQIQFFPPVEINASIMIEKSENKSYTDGLMRRNEPGTLYCSIYINHLEELGIDIKYGDYIGYPETEDKIRYYSVSNDGKVVTDNTHSMFGYKPFYRTITCAPVLDNEFRGI